MIWDEYERWNGAIAAELFSSDWAGLPAYLDLEDDALAAVAARAGAVSDDPAAALVAAVRATVATASVRSKVFAEHSARLRAWERSPNDEPPHLALLAVLSLAAEKMARGEGFSSTNYYGRLAPMLGMENRGNDLAQVYRAHAERWWGALNKWLERHDGRRGLPTAFTLTGSNQRYVGLPISQALVRAADRQSLVRFFRRVGFAPGTDVTPSTLVPLLDAWISQQPSPATRSLQRIWSKAATRPRVAEVAAVALASWDGAIDEGASGDTGADEYLRLVATLGGFLTERLEVGVLAYLEQPHQARELLVVGVAGEPVIAASPTTVGAMRLVGIEQAELGSIFDGALCVEDPLTGRRTTRRPRRVVPLRTDDLLQQLVETDQVQAGEDLVLLLKQELVAEVTALLEEVARPGWSLTEELAGLPRGWALAREVQVLRTPSRPPSLDLRSLTPLTRSHLKLAGGFSIPGRIRRWHTWLPPEIRAIDDANRPTVVRVVRTSDLDVPVHADSVVLEQTTSAGDITVIDCNRLGLGDGDYRVELCREGEEAPITTQMLRLRSGNSRDVLQWELAPVLGHSSSVAISALAAVAVESSGSWVRGAVAEDEQAREPATESRTASVAWWESGVETRASSPTGLWRVAAPDPSSCMFTGRHYILVPEAGPGRPLTRFIAGTCRDCGMVRRLPTTAWGAEKKKSAALPNTATVPTIDVSRVEPVRAEARDRLWEVALDTLQYLGGGDYGLLERAALQIEGSGLVVDSFIRTLEGLGHIEVSRSDDLRAEQWEITPTALAERTDGCWSLIGYWPAATLEDVQSTLREAGGEIYVVHSEHGLPLYYAETGSDSLPSFGHIEGVSVVSNASLALSGHLRPLSELVAALPRRSDALVGRVRRFSVEGARWEDATGIGGPGAYRVRRWSELDIVRTPEDVEQRTVARSTVQLSKHVAALGYGRALVAYDPATMELVVPLGAELPGLFGRVAILASGEPPVADRRARRLTYPSVPPDVASRIVRLMSS